MARNSENTANFIVYNQNIEADKILEPEKSNQEPDENNTELDEGNVMDSSMQHLDFDDDIDYMSIASAKGNRPINLFNEESVEVNAFPSLFLDGKHTFDETREAAITRSKYYNARIFSADSHFANNTEYIIFALYAKEYEVILSQISIILRKSDAGSKIARKTLLDKNKVQSVLKSDQGFKYFKTLRGSQFWKTTMNDFFAPSKNIGLPTLSSAEPSHIGAALRQ